MPSPTASAVWVDFAYMLGMAAFGVLIAIAVLFVYTNFIQPEMYHPLDWYSNKLRTRPHNFLGLIFIFGISSMVIMVTGSLPLMLKVPELAVAVYLQGFMIMVVMIAKESTATALCALLLYEFMCIASVLIVMIPDVPGNEPGWIYSAMFLIMNMVFTFWIKAGVRRHHGHDGEDKLVPEGAGRLFELWEKTVLRGNPLLLIATNLAFLCVFQINAGSIGWALAILYYVVAGLLLAGCCYSYRAGTEVD
jgi:hypothetical protein|mmetsp:Transcript_85580/g.184718  ORF Transcript_85580/g.184718 Transcript_85580/m.184718 type:complete len:249 (+) Transcript_85580:67-813(+)